MGDFGGKDGATKTEISMIEKKGPKGLEFKNFRIPENRGLIHQILASVAVSFGSMMVGFATSYSSPALVSMSEEVNPNLQPTQEQRSWIGSLLPLFAMIGGALGGGLIGYLGRRFTMIMSAFPYAISFLIVVFAPNIPTVMIGRSLMGLSVGLATLAFPIYLGETIEPKYRGILGLFPTTFGNSGVLLSYLAGMFLNWSNLAIIGAILPLPYVICSWILPETPRWSISKGQTKKCMKALQWLRGTENVTEEFNEIEAHQKKHQNTKSGYKDFFSVSYARPLFISLALMFFQQMSGINAIIFYSLEIFIASGSNINSNIQSIILAIINVLSTTMATVLIEKLGRKTLLYISSVIMSVTLILLGFYYKRISLGTDLVNESLGILDLMNYDWIPLACLIVYMIGFSIGFGPVPWLMMGELLPARMRCVGGALTTSFNWGCSFIVTKTFGTMTTTIGSSGTFWLYGVFCIISIFFIMLFVPETKGKSLEDIERMFFHSHTAKTSKRNSQEKNNKKSEENNGNVKLGSKI